MFEESKHPRDNGGKFTEKGGDSRDSYTQSVNERIRWAKENGVDLPLNIDGSVDDLKLQKMYEERITTELSSLLGKEFTGYKGQAAINKLMEERQGHIKGAFYRKDIGDIDLVWGNDAVGLKHIIKQREKEKEGHVEEIISHLATAIEKGEYNKQNERGNFELIYKENSVEYRTIIAPEYHKNKITYVLTAFRRNKKK